MDIKLEVSYSFGAVLWNHFCPILSMCSCPRCERVFLMWVQQAASTDSGPGRATKKGTAYILAIQVGPTTSWRDKQGPLTASPRARSSSSTKCSVVDVKIFLQHRSPTPIWTA